MEIYVEGELPENCIDCWNVNCRIGCKKNCYEHIVKKEYMTKRPADCHLRSLSDRLAEERKKVVQILKDKIEKRNNGTRNGNHSEQYKDGYSGCCCDVVELLDQIERKTDETN